MVTLSVDPIVVVAMAAALAKLGAGIATKLAETKLGATTTGAACTAVESPQPVSNEAIDIEPKGNMGALTINLSA